ncbi:hypothetical protein M1614_03690 [Candidatus Marsarchaeota archaeon]|jgi:hypothetical protein|nr:hypothetical protein [Candidatus Marsarchaeota archaeon]MCL5089615.1 hypothetical protein [Candidatus Marsarchaeota archaeon]
MERTCDQDAAKNIGAEKEYPLAAKAMMSFRKAGQILKGGKRHKFIMHDIKELVTELSEGLKSDKLAVSDVVDIISNFPNDATNRERVKSGVYDLKVKSIVKILKDYKTFRTEKIDAAWMLYKLTEFESTYESFKTGLIIQMKHPEVEDTYFNLTLEIEKAKKRSIMRFY